MFQENQRHMTRPCLKIKQNKLLISYNYILFMTRITKVLLCGPAWTSMCRLGYLWTNRAPSTSASWMHALYSWRNNRDSWVRQYTPLIPSTEETTVGRLPMSSRPAWSRDSCQQSLNSESPSQVKMKTNQTKNIWIQVYIKTGLKPNSAMVCNTRVTKATQSSTQDRMALTSSPTREQMTILEPPILYFLSFII